LPAPESEKGSPHGLPFLLALRHCSLSAIQRNPDQKIPLPLCMLATAMHPSLRPSTHLPSCTFRCGHVHIATVTRHCATAMHLYMTAVSVLERARLASDCVQPADLGAGMFISMPLDKA